MATGLLFERDAVEEIERWDDGLTRRRRSSVLWIDVERLSDQKESAPKFVGGKDRFHLTCYAPAHRRQLARVECILSERCVRDWI